MLFALFIILAHLLILSRITFTAWPEMLSYPYLVANGYIPYKDFVVPYPPGLIYLLSGTFNLFGFSVDVLRSFTWVLIILTDIVLFSILKLLTKNNLISAFFLSVYIILQSFLDGNMLWVDYATVLPLLLAIYFLIRWVKTHKNKSLFSSVLFLWITFLVKQIAVVYLGAFAIFLIFLSFQKNKKENFNQLLTVISATAAVIIPFLIYLLVNNNLVSFINWCFYYPLTEWRNFPGYVDYLITKKEIAITLLLFVLSSFLVLKARDLLRDKILIILSLMVLAAFLAVYPRFSYFHLQPMIAVIIIISTYIYFTSNKFKKLNLFLVCLITSLIVFLVKDQVLDGGTRFYSEDDKRLTSEIKTKLEGERITYFLGLNSSQYIFTNTLPPKPWIEGFGWYMETTGAQEDFTRGFEKFKPKVVFRKVPKAGMWYLLESYQPKLVLDYIYNNYTQDGIIDKGEVEVWKRKKE